MRSGFVVLDSKDAMRAVSDHLSKLEKVVGEPLALIENETIEKPFGWIFFYNSKKYTDTGDIKYMLAGNAPIILDKNTGKIHETGTAYPVEYYIEEYERSKSQRE